MDFREKTITINSILWPTRNIVNLQIKPSVTQDKLLSESTGYQDAKHDIAEIPEIVRTSCPHLMPS